MPLKKPKLWSLNMCRFKISVFVFLAFFYLNEGFAQVQCILTGLSPSYCLNAPAANLTVSPAGGLLSGAAITNSVFSPASAGIGSHTVNYAYCSSLYSIESLAFIQIPYIPVMVNLGDEQMSPQIPIGFTFKFFCQDYTNFFISSNGFITFSSTQSPGCCQGLALPNSGISDIIACSWTDLDPSQGGTIRYCYFGTAPNRSLLVSFNCIFHKTGQGPVTSEIWLYESSNEIEISTVTKPIPTSTVQYNTTMGIQGGNSQAFVVPGRNGTSNWTATNELLRFTPGGECSLTQTVNVYPNPTLIATSSKSYICSGESINLNATGSIYYTWNNLYTGSTIIVTPTISTTYTVIGTDANGCSGSGTVQVKTSNCSQINENNLSDNVLFSVAPNPSNGVIRIQSKTYLVLELKNEQGQNLRNLEFTEDNKYTVSLEYLPVGIYFLNSQNGGNRLNKKVIVIAN